MRDMSAQQGYSYRIQDLTYRAISVAKFETLLGAYVSAGRYYEFGASVREGVEILRDYYGNVMKRCPETRWVLAGYSQGAMVVGEAVRYFRADKVIYIGLFGDPQLHLPEGSGVWPKACRGKELSEYRVFAPDCRTEKGSLGVRNPYQYGELHGKYGIWCAKKDYICGSSRNPLQNDGHMSYADIGVAWMTDLVATKLPNRTAFRSVTRLASKAKSVVAALPFTDYYASAGEEVTFDASNSLGGNLLYEWDFGDGWHIGATEEERSFPTDTTVRLRVLGDEGVSEVVAVVHVDAPIEQRLVTPEIGIGKDGSGLVYVTPNNVPPGASYLLVRLNGFDLGYAEAGKRMRIGELNFTEDEELSFYWMDAEYNVGDGLRIKASDIVYDESLGMTFEEIVGDGKQDSGQVPEDIVPVMTGVRLVSGWGYLGMVAAVLWLVILLVWLGMRVWRRCHKKGARWSGRPRERP